MERTIARISNPVIQYTDRSLRAILTIIGCCTVSLLSDSATLKFNGPSSIKAEVQFENTNIINQGVNPQQQIEYGQFIIQTDKKKNRILLQIQGYEVDQLTPAVEQARLAQLGNVVSQLIKEVRAFMPRGQICSDFPLSIY